MSVRCPCGVKVKGEDERETSANVREHLIGDHNVPSQNLMDVVALRDELGDEAVDELMKMDASMKAHLAPPTRAQEEINKDNEQNCMVGCVSELPLTSEQTGAYGASMFCSFCAKRLIADDEEGLSRNWGEHLTAHARAGLIPLEQVVLRS